MEHKSIVVNFVISYEEFIKQSRWRVVIILVLMILCIIDYINSTLTRYVVLDSSIPLGAKQAIEEHVGQFTKQFGDTKISKLYRIFRCLFMHYDDHCFYIYQNSNEEIRIDDNYHIAILMGEGELVDFKKYLQENFNKYWSESVNFGRLWFVMNLLWLLTFIAFALGRRTSCKEKLSEASDNAKFNSVNTSSTTKSQNCLDFIDTKGVVFIIIFKIAYASFVNFVIYNSDEVFKKNVDFAYLFNFFDRFIIFPCLFWLFSKNTKVIMNDELYNLNLFKRIRYCFTA